MNGQEIRERIDSNNAKINRALKKFVLTDEINKLMKDNEELRFICNHQFENGFCKFCDIPIDFMEDKE